MKDYSIGENKKSYIVRIEEDQVNGTFSVVFADGSRFTDIEANEENIMKVIRIQEKQAKNAIDNKAVFTGRKTKAGILTGLSAGAMLAGTTAVSSIPAVSTALAGQDPVVVACGIGVITVLGAIPAFAKFMRESSKVKELEKLEYLTTNIKKLESYTRHHNALSGLNKKAKRHFSDSEEAFCILDIDNYELEDLQRMMENIEKEDELAFTYKKVEGPAKK